jgi:putative transcriptional regulator
MSGFVSLQGSLLIASPALLDPNFRRTVVLLTEHDAEAAMGVVLNRRLEVAVVDAVPVLADLVEEGAQVFEGGPVQSGSVLALADFCEPAQSAALAFGSVGYLRGDEDPAALVGDVTAVRVFSGYSGWGPGQLEAELEQEAWITLPAVVDDVFGDPDGLWSRALARKGGRYKLVASLPDDPSLN